MSSRPQGPTPPSVSGSPKLATTSGQLSLLSTKSTNSTARSPQSCHHKLAKLRSGPSKGGQVRLPPSTTKGASLGGDSNGSDSIKYWHHKQTGIKSRSIKPLKHPVEHIERKIVFTYLLSLIFKLIAILSGPLIVLLVHLLTLPIVAARRALWFLLNLECVLGAKIRTHNIDSLGDRSPLCGPEKELQWKYCPLNFLETYWFKESLVNTVVLVLKKDPSGCHQDKLQITELRRLFRETVLCKPAFRKFLSRVVKRGVPFCKSLYWQYLGLEPERQQTPSEPGGQISDHLVTNNSRSSLASACSLDLEGSVSSSRSSSDKSLNSGSSSSCIYDVCIALPPNEPNEGAQVDLRQHIYIDQSIACGQSLNLASIRRHSHSLLEVGLNTSRPLWELRLIPSKDEAKSYLIFRCHQSLADGQSLSKLLTKHLVVESCDQSERFLTDKPLQNVATCQQSTGLDEAPTGKLEDLWENENELRPMKEKKSFVSRISSSSGFRSAVFVGPLTVLLWIIWAFTRRKNNHLNRCSPEKKLKIDSSSNLQVNYFNSRRFSMAQFSLTKFYQIKQMTRSTVNDVILCAFSGALRNYLSHHNAVSNPPNLNVTLTVDMRQSVQSSMDLASQQSGPVDVSSTGLDSTRFQEQQSDESSVLQDSPELHPTDLDDFQVNTTMVNVSLPISVEGIVPRLWELRSTTEEMRASADPWVMLGLQRFLHLLLPKEAYRWLINYIMLRNSSAFVSNIRGPNNMVESWCVDLAERAILESRQPPKIFRPLDSEGNIVSTQLESSKRSRAKRSRDMAGRLKLKAGLGYLTSIYYCMQPPSGNIPISFNCITYHNKIFITSLSRSLLVEDSKLLLRLFLAQLNQLAGTIAKRRTLITYIQCPVPIEINSRPPSPKTPIELARVKSHKNLAFVEALEMDSGDSGQQEATSSTARRGSAGIIECLGSNSFINRDKCQICNGKVCLCKRRKSLFAIEATRQRPANLLGLFNPSQMMSIAKGRGTGNSSCEPDNDFLCDGHFL